MSADPFADFYDDGEDLTTDEWQTLTKTEKQSVRHRRAQTNKYEVGLVPPPSPEIIERRERYENDYVIMHQEVFKRSTGIKPFGVAQETSIRQTHNIIKHRGRAVIAEPRGFGKTSRTTNNCLAAVLQGKIRYALILASSVTKASEILEAILSEVFDNEELYQLYPAVCRCFEKSADSQYATKYQTYGGEHTYIEVKKDRIRFPQIPGEASSGSVIQVRPKDNVRGLFTKIRYGPESGRVLRPDFVFMDDIQTDEEADSIDGRVPKKIVKTIKKSVMYAGTHSKRISAVMCCTPIAAGDVASHFILNEPSWEVTLYKMVPKMPKNIEKWLVDYREVYLNFNKFIPGDRLRAALDAKQFVLDNYDELHEGAEVAWEWAYGWAEEPQTEVSALHHAMNFLIEEGRDSFETECQCNVEARNDDGTEVKATLDEITNKIGRFPRYHCSLDTHYITTHIDVNKDILTYVTMSSPQVLRPTIVDYGTWPRQPGSLWEKGRIVNPLSAQYNDIPELENQIYTGLCDLLDSLASMEYPREDGAQMVHNFITVDMGWKIDDVQRAIRDNTHRHILACARGMGLTARVKEFGSRHYGPDCLVFHHCALVPTLDRQMMALYADVNYFKTLLHKGFKARQGITNSVDLFLPNQNETHLLFAEHCISETPSEDVNELDGRSVIIWSPPRGDNEYFDNAVGCLANLMRLGCKLSSNQLRNKKKINMQDYINQQKN